MEEERVSLGSKVMDNLLDGGLETGILTTVYGPGGSGKTCVCMLASIHQALKEKRTIYIDTESNFSLSRLKQLAPEYKKVLNSIVFIRPVSMDAQKKALLKLKDVKTKNIGLVAVDSIATPYRLERTKEKLDINRELSLQLSYLNEIARSRGIPVLLTDQVYSDFENRGSVKLVGGDIIGYASKCLIELKKFTRNRRQAIIKRHRSIEEGKSILFEISENGLEATPL